MSIEFCEFPECICANERFCLKTGRVPEPGDKVHLPVLKDTCPRCGLEDLRHRSDPTDCDYCDPLCPIWGTHGHLWNGDEESSRAAFHAAKEQEK